MSDQSPSFWVVPATGDEAADDNELTASSFRFFHCRFHRSFLQRQNMMDSPVHQVELSHSAATERRNAFLEQRRERLAAGLARVDRTRSLREEQLQRLREKGRDVQRRLEMACAGKQQRLQSTTEKCSERVAHAKAVAARIREKENERKSIKMQKYRDRLQENEARRCNHLRKRSNMSNRNEGHASQAGGCLAADENYAATAIQRWWRRVCVKRAAAAFRAAVPRTLIRLLRGQPVEKLTYPIAQHIVSLPEVVAATQTLLWKLAQVCPHIGVTDCKSTTRQARFVLSSLIIKFFPKDVIEQEEAAADQLKASAAGLFTAFAKVVGLRRSTRRLRLMLFLANWHSFQGAFSAWKKQDSARLIASYREHWLQLAALKQTVMSQEGTEHDEAQSQFVPNIERQQQDILVAVRRLAGQAGVSHFIASLSVAPVVQTIEHPTGNDGANKGSTSDSSQAAESSRTSSAPASAGQGSSPGGAAASNQEGDAASAGGGGGGGNNAPPGRQHVADDGGEAGSHLDVAAIAQNLEMAHELVLDEDYKLRQPEAAPGSLMAQVRSTMMVAFWDLLREQLKQDPPVFDQVLNLLHDVKEYLLSALPSRRVTTLHMQIDAGLDIDLIKQQMQQGILNIKSLAQFVLDVMQRICAPSRDADVQQLVAMLGADDLDIAAIFKGILDLLSLMRLDLANHELKSIRPVLLQHSARYEREKFEQLFPDAPDSGLEHTVAWLTKAQQSCAVAAPGPCSPLGVLRQAFTDLITESVEHGPETWWLDTKRLEMMSSQLKCAVFVQTLSVLIGGLLGREIANSAEFMAQLRDTLFILLDDGNMGDPDEARGHVSVQVISSVNKYREAHGLPPLDDELRQKVELAVTQSHSLENPVHNVLSRRLKACINQAITSQVKHPAELDVPGGFQLVEQRLRTVITSFSRLAVYNQKVFGPIYSTLLQRLCQV
ncbi:T-complex protein 11-like protein 2 [Sycon ciliatum]|uniref:T-complex protein 11-like protein 2 n=1 Tax=Sycon ciliatum TaxID=27933 RepID=UPI0031F69C79